MKQAGINPWTPAVAILCGLAGFHQGLKAIGTDAPNPFPAPVRFQSLLGDPDRGPEPEPQYLPIDIEWDEERARETVNQGDPYRDYGHFRLTLGALFTVNNGSGLTEVTDDEIREVLDRYEPAVSWDDGEHVRYSVLRPPEDTQMPENGWPLVVYCPGSGAVGRQDIRRPNLSEGYPDRVPDEAVWATDYFRAYYPAYVLVMHPQGRTVNYREGPYERTPVLHGYLAVIDHFMETEPIDPKRVYTLGFSMGGSTIWQMLLERPNLFAAAAPLAGNTWSFGNEAAARIKDIPIWMMIGNQDTWSGSARYIRAYHDLTDLGAERLRLWEIQDLAHQDLPLKSLHLPEWLFSQTMDREPLVALPQIVLSEVRLIPGEVPAARIAFETKQGFEYWLQTATLNTGTIEWTDVSGASVSGSGDIHSLEAPLESEPRERFFRVRGRPDDAQ